MPCLLLGYNHSSDQRLSTMFLHQSRQIFALAIPILIAQLASISMAIIDTAMLGHFRTEDLAGVAVGAGIYVAILLALVGIVQAVAPIVAHHKGAQRDDKIAGSLQQTFWLICFISLPGILILNNPDFFFAISRIDSVIEIKARQYLTMLSWGLPAALFYRAFYAFCGALGQPKPLMIISFCGSALHALLVWLLITGQWGGEPLGSLGCGISNALVNWFVFICGIVYMAKSQRFRQYHIFSNWQRPQKKTLRELLRLGLPMGLSSFVEVSSFTLSAVFVAQLGAHTVSGHRIVANLAAIVYMMPLSVAMATLTYVGNAVGARDWKRAGSAAWAGVCQATLFAGLLSIILWALRDYFIAVYTNDLGVRVIALMLIVYVCLYQIFDAIQTVSAFALRGYKITFVPMLVHIICFWGIGLFGGWWLAFRAPRPMGVTGFWIASLTNLIIASVLLGGMLYWRSRQR